MPSKSKAQHNLMAAVAKNPEFAKKTGIKQSVGEEFLKADKGRRFGTGGDVNYSYGGKGQINKQRTRFGSQFGYKLNAPDENLTKYVGKKEGGSVATKKLFGGKETRAEEMKEAKALKSGKISKAQYVAGEKSEGHGKGAAKTASAIKSGKITPAQYAKAETMMRDGGKTQKMAKGGNAKPDVKIAMSAKKIAPTRPTMPGAPRGAMPVGSPMMGRAPAVMPQRPAAPMMAKGGLAAGHKSADGVAKKGKTKGAEVKMARGGKTKKYC